MAAAASFSNSVVTFAVSPTHLMISQGALIRIFLVLSAGLGHVRLSVFTAETSNYTDCEQNFGQLLLFIRSSTIKIMTARAMGALRSE